jgi:CRP-like cAMP-binding protein
MGLRKDFPLELESASRRLLLGTSLYALDEETGRVEYRLNGSRFLSTVVLHTSFMRWLPPSQRQELLRASTSRAYTRKDMIRGSASSMVHIVLSGCVAEESTYGETTSVRILGTGAVLGDLEVFDPDRPTPTTRCLNSTWTLTLPLDRMRMYAESMPDIAMALGRAATERLSDTERVYNRPGLRPEQRLAGLFVHLLGTCAVPSERFGRMIEGPSQQDLADALSVSRATIEAAMRELREDKLVVTGYRTFAFPSEPALAEVGKVRVPPQRVTGMASHQ